MYLTTDRLLIRNFEVKDWQAVHEYTSDQNVMKYLPEDVFTEAAAKEFVKENMDETPKHYPVVLNDENFVIGHMAFHKYFGEHTYEIGWVFNPKYYYKGYATEAARAILACGFEKMKLHRIIATCQPENVASFRVMEKIGMRSEGHFKKCIPQGDEWWDEYYYAILAEEWVKIGPVYK